MPQPLTERQRAGTYWNALALEERPECALGVAKVASAWGFLEFTLAQMFWSATGDFEPNAEGERDLVGHPLAVSALGALESTAARLDVIAAGIAAYLPDLSDMFEQLRTGIRGCARERNRVVHAVWGVNAAYPNHVIKVDTFSDEYVKYTPQDFANIVSRTREQVKRVEAFSDACTQVRFTEIE